MRFLIAFHTLFFFLPAVLYGKYQIAIPAHAYVVMADKMGQDIDPSAFIKNKIYIDHIELIAYDSMHKTEFSYLTGLFEGMHITPEGLRYAVMQLGKKKWYESFSFWVEKKNNKTVLFVYLHKRWLIEKIKISGPLFHKQQYIRHYGFDTGSVFSAKKHHNGVIRVREALRDEGLLQATVEDVLLYDNNKKNVSISLLVRPGKVAVVEALNLKHNEGIQNSDLKKDIFELLDHILCKNYATQKNAEAAHTAVQSYLQKRGFVNTRVSIKYRYDAKNNKTVADCDIHYGDYVGSINFFGNMFFSKERLHEYINERLVPGAFVPAWLLVSLLEELYKKKGFFNAVIRVHEKKNSYMVHINEGRRSVVRALTLSLADEQSSIDISKDYEFFKGVSGSFFDEDLLYDLCDAWAHAYKQKGFWHFSVDELQTYHVAHRCVHVSIIAKKNEQFIINRLCLDEYPELLKESFVMRWSELLPCGISVAKIEELKTFIMQYFYDNGFLYVSVDYTVIKDQESSEGYVLAWTIKPGNKITFGKVVITGKTAVPFDMILRLLPFKEGDVWNFKTISQASFRLRDLGIFETIRLYPDPAERDTSQKNIVLHLVDDDPCEVRFRAGFQQVSKNYTFRAGSTYKLGGSLLYKNPLYAGDLISFEADVTRFYRYVSGTYNRPWIGGIPLYGIAKGYANKYVQPIRIGDQQPLYYARQEGGLIGCSYKWDLGSFGVNTGVELVETSHLSTEVAHAIDFEPLLIDEKIPYFFIEPSYFYETLDDKFDPFSGMMFVLNTKGLFSWKKGGINFFKMLCEYSYFIPLWRGVFALHNRCGHIFHHNIKNIMPIERFYLGGANSLRGYQPDLAPPLGLFMDDGQEKRVPQGGQTVFNASVEYRLPIKYGIGIVLFQDMGILLKNSFADFKKERLLAATGFGLRYKTPIGPLRFDIGWKWHKEEYEDNRYACFLTFGHSF